MTSKERRWRRGGCGSGPQWETMEAAPQCGRERPCESWRSNRPRIRAADMAQRGYGRYRAVMSAANISATAEPFCAAMRCPPLGCIAEEACRWHGGHAVPSCEDSRIQSDGFPDTRSPLQIERRKVLHATEAQLLRIRCGGRESIHRARQPLLCWVTIRRETASRYVQSRRVEERRRRTSRDMLHLTSHHRVMSRHLSGVAERLAAAWGAVGRARLRTSPSKRLQVLYGSAEREDSRTSSESGSLHATATIRAPRFVQHWEQLQRGALQSVGVTSRLRARADQVCLHCIYLNPKICQHRKDSIKLGTRSDQMQQALTPASM